MSERLGFSKFALQVANFLQFMLQFMQITKDFAVFPVRVYHNFNLWPNVLCTLNNKSRPLWTIQSTRDTISIHNDYGSKSVLFFY